MRRAHSPSDMSNQQWAILEPLIPPAKPGGHPRTTDMREVINAILYLDRTGGQWRALPHDFPPWSTVWTYFRTWRVPRDLATPPYNAPREDPPEAGTRVNAECRDHRQSIGENQSKRGLRGYDGGKKVKGRKRHLLVDTTGLLMQVLVHAANLQDHDGGKELLAPLKGLFPRMKLIWTDSAYEKGDNALVGQGNAGLDGRGGEASLERPARCLGPRGSGH
jgi:putative transposase